jgi:NAD(P)-dependent dehydrogenase (short-subunit alcohol dehydrogenase family)
MKKVAIITGAAGNLGKAVVKAFIDNGYQVTGIVSSRTSPEFVNSSGIEMFQADLSDESSIREILQRIFDKYYNINAAILTAGGYAGGDIRTTGKNGLDKMYRLNFETNYFTAREVFQKMETQQGGGKIVFIGSKPALNPGEGKNSIAYTLTKSMLFGLSDIINEEGKNKSVYSTIVIPEIIDTPENRLAMPGSDFSQWTSPELIAGKIFSFVNDSHSIPPPVLKLFGNS